MPAHKKHGGKRTGAGRPRKYEESEKIDVRVPVAVIAALEALAAQREVTRSDVLVSILLKSKAVTDAMKKLD